MKRALIDLSSVIWTCMLAGEDREFGRWLLINGDDVKELERAEAKALPASGPLGKRVHVNSAGYGYENAMNHLVKVMDELQLVPRDMIFVIEGKNSKGTRQNIHPGYKASRDKVAQQYEEFNKCKEELLQTFLNLGSRACWQDGGLEADDVLGYLATHLRGERWIVSGDKDLAQLVGTDPDIHHYRSGKIDENPFGEFPHRLIPTYIALVGDTSDKIPGARGFGDGAFQKMYMLWGDEGLEAMHDLIITKDLKRLEEDVGQLKELQKVIDDADGVYMSYELARLRIDSVNTLKRRLQWRVGMVKQRSTQMDDRLRKHGGTISLVSAEKLEQARKWLFQQFCQSPEIALDVETSTPPESDEWLAQGNREDKVDVLGSELTSLQLTFGSNMQHTIYLPVDNVEEPGVTNVEVRKVAEIVDMIPREKRVLVHHAAFELPVCFMAWGDLWKADRDWHGFLRNVRDTRVMAHHVDENRSLHLKSLSKELLDYEQTNYAQVTTKVYEEAQWNGKGKLLEEYQSGALMVRVQHKMNELTAREVLHYGADDTICTAALAAHFQDVMEIEGTIDAFELCEPLPSYVHAKSFIDGIPFSLERMRLMQDEDVIASDKAWKVLSEYLIKIGYEGTQCPVFDMVSPATVHEAFQLVLGVEFPNKRLKLMDKIVKTIRLWAEEQTDDDLKSLAYVLATVVAADDVKQLNEFVQRYFTAAPQINLGSPKQMNAFLYGTMKLPVNFVNDVTDIEKEKTPDLADAVNRFKKKRAGSKEVVITEADQELLRKKAKTDESAVLYGVAFDHDHLDDEAKAALAALGTMKKVKTRHTLFYDKYWNALHWKTGLIHPNITQCGTVTRRPTGSDPNPYQWPKKGEGAKFRENIKPHKKNAIVVSIDFVAQELRIGAERSQDPNLLACYVGENLKDVHSLTSVVAMRTKWGDATTDELFDKYGPDLARDSDGEYQLFLRLRKLPKSDLWQKKADDLRKDSKNTNFTAQFGGQAPKIAQRIIIKIEDAQVFLDARAKMFPRLLDAAERAEDFAGRYGYALTMMKGRRHLQDSVLSHDKWTVSRAERQAWNMEIQGSAAEMMKRAMAKAWERGILHRYDMVFYAAIYDELVFSVTADDAIECIREMHGCMVEPYADMKVPILGSISLGPDFGTQIECGDDFIPENVSGAVWAAMNGGVPEGYATRAKELGVDVLALIHRIKVLGGIENDIFAKDAA